MQKIKTYNLNIIKNTIIKIVLIAIVFGCEKKHNKTKETNPSPPNITDRFTTFNNGVIYFERHAVMALPNPNAYTYEYKLFIEMNKIIKAEIVGPEGSFVYENEPELSSLNWDLKLLKVLKLGVLPTQSQLPDDSVVTNDGTNFYITFKNKELVDSLYYHNPSRHFRIEDQLVVRIFDVLEEFYNTRVSTKQWLKELKEKSKIKE